jgi:hypothetical protein
LIKRGHNAPFFIQSDLKTFGYNVLYIDVVLVPNLQVGNPHLGSSSFSKQEAGASKIAFPSQSLGTSGT